MNQATHQRASGGWLAALGCAVSLVLAGCDGGAALVMPPEESPGAPGAVYPGSQHPGSPPSIDDEPANGGDRETGLPPEAAGPNVPLPLPAGDPPAQPDASGETPSGDPASDPSGDPGQPGDDPEGVPDDPDAPEEPPPGEDPGPGDPDDSTDPEPLPTEPDEPEPVDQQPEPAEEGPADPDGSDGDDGPANDPPGGDEPDEESPGNQPPSDDIPDAPDPSPPPGNGPTQPPFEPPEGNGDVIGPQSPEIPGGLPSFRISIIGSSTAQGIGASAPALAWANQLEASLRQRVTTSITSENLAVGGYTAYDLAPGSGASGSIDAAIREAPDLILVALAGSNDLDGTITTEFFVSQLIALRESAKAAGIPTFFMGTLPKNFNEPNRQLLVDFDRAMASEFGACWIPGASQRYAPCYIDVFNSLADGSLGLAPDYDSGDGQHPNDAGHAVLFRAAQAIVEPYVCSKTSCR